MAKILWKGFTRRVVPAPRRPLQPDARPLLIPRRHYWPKAILLAAPVYLPVLTSLYLKNSLLQTDLRDKPWIVAGMVLALLLGPLHECLHARSPHPPGALLRDVPAAHAALPHTLDGLPALSGRGQGSGVAVLGMRHHVRRSACSRLYERPVRLAAGAVQSAVAGRVRRRRLLVRA